MEIAVEATATAAAEKPAGSVESSAAGGRGFEEEEEEEGDVCRICRNPGDADNPLRYPCACSGSIKFVHQECLLQWLNHSNARQCEVSVGLEVVVEEELSLASMVTGLFIGRLVDEFVCKHAFSFSPVYAANAPARLPFQEFVVGMAMKACHVLQFFLRLAFVLSVWLLIIPFITFWIWRLAFVRSIVEAQRLFLSHMSTTVILTDCLHGFLLSASIVFIFLGATSLRDYFRHLREIGGQDVDRDEEGDRNGARAARRQAPANRANAGDGNGEDAGGGQGIAGAGQLIRRNAENVAARLEMQAARLEAHVEQMFDGLDDADGAEDVPFDELVGMQGPVFHLVENAFTVLASNMIFLGVVIFVPFTIGRIVLYYLSWVFSAATSPVLLTVMPFTESALSVANVTLRTALTAVTNISTGSNKDGVLDNVAEVVAETMKANATNLGEVSNTVGKTLSADLMSSSSLGASRLSDVTTLAVGYMFIFSLVFLYLGVIAVIRYTRGEPLTVGRLYGIASIVEAIPSLLRQFLAAMRHLMTMIKVAFLLVIELGVFPLMCGWWLDVCTIKMLGKTIAQRVEFFSISPLASSLVHWIVGIFYMLQISIFVSLLRGVLRNGVLYFLRDPADPNYNPFRDLIDDPVHKHARRVLLSVGVYGSLIVMLVFLPVKLAMRLAPSIFPLDVSLSDPFTEIPADVLLFQICIPFAIEHFKLRATIKALLRQWFTVVGWALGLTEFLLPVPDDNNGGQEAGNVERQDRLRDVQGGAGLQDRAIVAFVPAAGPNRAINGSSNSDIAEDYDNDEQADSEYGFVLRIVILLVLAWMTLLLFNSALIVVPISLGRALFNNIPLLPITHGIKCNDLYAFVIGSYVIWTAIAGIRYCIEHIKTQRARTLLTQIWKWCGIVCKSSILLSIWILVIPVLIGLLFELLVIVPMRVPVDESPVFLLYQDWALGLIFLKIWTRLVSWRGVRSLTGKLQLILFDWLCKLNFPLCTIIRRFCSGMLVRDICFMDPNLFEGFIPKKRLSALFEFPAPLFVMLDHMTPLVDESWRMKFERVRDDGFSRLQGLWVMREIVIPIIVKLLTALCVPYVFARGVFPIFGYPLIVNSAVYRFAWVGCLSFSLLCFCAKRFHVWFTNLHNSIRDDRYLIGRRLHNFGEDRADSGNGSDIIPQSQDIVNSQDAVFIRREQEGDVGARLRNINRRNPQRQAVRLVVVVGVNSRSCERSRYLSPPRESSRKHNRSTVGGLWQMPRHASAIVSMLVAPLQFLSLPISLFHFFFSSSFPATPPLDPVEFSVIGKAPRQLPRFLPFFPSFFSRFGDQVSGLGFGGFGGDCCSGHLFAPPSSPIPFLHPLLWMFVFLGKNRSSLFDCLIDNGEKLSEAKRLGNGGGEGEGELDTESIVEMRKTKELWGREAIGVVDAHHVLPLRRSFTDLLPTSAIRSEYIAETLTRLTIC
ncbi:hypothetical protein Syun_015263 [Stephania yunnanensis]|uniref:RING-type E3 ubiquitin transferase n=1 Tax=Stephania yunnanensis TaxID=152371 RepID=A0AAP0JMK2_9MAGN